MNFSVNRLHMKSRFSASPASKRITCSLQTVFPGAVAEQSSSPAAGAGWFLIHGSSRPALERPEVGALEGTQAPSHELGVLAQVPFLLHALEHELQTQERDASPPALRATRVAMLTLPRTKYTRKHPSRRCLAHKRDRSIMGFEMFGNLTPDFVRLSLVTVIRW